MLKFTLNKKEQEMVKDNKGLAVSIAKRIYKTNAANPQNIALVTFDEVLEAAMYGLIYAVRGFDETLGYKFSTYAYKTIYGRVLTFLYKENKLIKTNKDVMVSSFNVKIYNADDDNGAFSYEDLIVDDRAEDEYKMIEYDDLMKRTLSAREYEVFRSRVFDKEGWQGLSSRMGYSINTLRSDYKRSVIKLRYRLTPK